MRFVQNSAFTPFKMALSILLLLGGLPAHGQGGAGGIKSSPMRKASELIRHQELARTTPRVYDKLTPDTARVSISLSKQRLFLMLGEEVAIDTPISSGKAAGMTPTGDFVIQEKDPDHRSSIYGDFVDNKGRVVRSGVSLRIDSAPSGTHYVGAPMKWFCRIKEGVGMHIGILPGYPASHGCVRLPADIAPLIYQKVKVGTPVEIVN